MMRSFRPSLMLCAFALAAGLAGAQAQRPAAAQPTHKDLVYGQAGGQPLKLDLYLPKEGAKPAPVLISIHGGGWRGGSKDRPAPYKTAMVELGWAVAAVQYRLTSQAGQWGDAPVIFPAQINDVKGAVRWLRANAKKYNLDPERFAAWGESAGGHLTALLVTSGEAKEIEGDVGGNLEFSSKVQAGVDYFGPTDLAHIGVDKGRPEGLAGEGGRANANNAVSNLVGFNPAEGDKVDISKVLSGEDTKYADVLRRLKQANPITWIGPNTPPLFIGHGSADPTVPIMQSRRIEEALKKAGVKVQMMVTEGAGHGGLSNETHLAGIRFLCEVLQPESVAKVGAIELNMAPAGAKKARKK